MIRGQPVSRIALLRIAGIDSCDDGEQTYAQKQREVSYEAECR